MNSMGKTMSTIMTKDMQRFIYGVYKRWKVNKDHIEPKHYLNALQKKLPDAEAITETPFGVRIKCNDGTLKVNVQTVNGKLIIRGIPRPYGGQNRNKAG